MLITPIAMLPRGGQILTVLREAMNAQAVYAILRVLTRRHRPEQIDSPKSQRYSKPSNSITLFNRLVTSPTRPTTMPKQLFPFRILLLSIVLSAVFSLLAGIAIGRTAKPLSEYFRRHVLHHSPERTATNYPTTHNAYTPLATSNPSLDTINWHAIHDPSHAGFAFEYPDQLILFDHLIKQKEDSHAPYNRDSRSLQLSRPDSVERTPVGTFEKPLFIIRIWDNPQKLRPRDWYQQIVQNNSGQPIIDQEEITFDEDTAYHFFDSATSSSNDYYFTDPARQFMFRFSVDPLVLQVPATARDLSLFYQIFSTFRFTQR